MLDPTTGGGGEGGLQSVKEPVSLGCKMWEAVDQIMVG